MSVNFPGGGVGRLLLVLLTVVAFGLAAVLALASSAWPLPCGIGLVLLAARFSNTVAGIASLRGDAERGVVTLVLTDGRNIDLSRGVLKQARITTHTSSGSSGTGTSTSYGVALGKRDGGMIRLLSEGNRRHVAEDMIERVNQILTATPDDDDLGRDVIEDARRALERASAVDITTEEGAAGYRDGATADLVVSWSLARPWAQALSGAIASWGVASTAFGVGMLIDSSIPAVVTALMSVLGLYAAFLAVRDQRARQLLRVSHQHLTCQRLRGSMTLEEKTIPVDGVDAVDVDWQRGLILRLDGANEEIRKMTEASESGVGVFGAVAKGIIAMTRKTLQIPTGALPLETRIAIETVVGAEIAARSGREASEL